MSKSTQPKLLVKKRESTAPVKQTKNAAPVLLVLNSSTILVTTDSTYEKAESIEAMKRVNMKNPSHPLLLVSGSREVASAKAMNPRPTELFWLAAELPLAYKYPMTPQATSPARIEKMKSSMAITTAFMITGCLMWL